MTDIADTSGIPKIYAYTEPQYEHAQWEGERRGKGEGFIKVGYTQKKMSEKVKDLRSVKAPIKNSIKVLLVEKAIMPDGKTSFMDHDVHKVLENSGITRRNKSEWFECTLDEVKQAICAVKEGKKHIKKRILNFKMRPEQEKAVLLTTNFFRKHTLEKDKHPPHFLWNAKMRFGKTFTSYQLAKAMNWSKILILTFKPAVKRAWRDDLLTHEDFEGWEFYSTADNINENGKFALFASFQDIMQTTADKRIKPKNQKLQDIDWDCIILDEYHFGAWNENAKELYAAEESETKLHENDPQKDFEEEKLQLKTKAYLYLSGTPFRALANGEFLEDQIFNWTYQDEQKAKSEWNGDNNPYAELPQMNMITYKISKMMKIKQQEGEYDDFDLNKFFEAENKNDGTSVFKHEDEVRQWLRFICGKTEPILQQSFKDNTELIESSISGRPFADPSLMKYLIHTFWFLPSVAACRAMGKLMKEDPFFSRYKIVVCAGNEVGVGEKALESVKEAIGNGIGSSPTITLSCGKLTTGVTVPEWTGIFMLRNISAPETYFQAAFRVQSPWVRKDKNGSQKIIKRNCYIFDFSFDRALRLIADYSVQLCKKENGDKNQHIEPEKRIDEFLRFFPIWCYDDTCMDKKPISASALLDISIAGTSATMLARKWESPMLIDVRDFVLEKLQNDSETMAILEKIESFRNSKVDVRSSISEIVKHAHKAKSNSENKNELTPQEKELRKKRREIQEKLVKFAARIPIFMYLTDEREETLLDIIEIIDRTHLFQKVTGINLQEFKKLKSIGLFNEKNMNNAVFAFRCYEEDSLRYTGATKHNGLIIGGWSEKKEHKELKGYLADFFGWKS
ncbi:MAG: GIY-YIG nuclease family protein [Alphaproteobacteria bacterium]|nr:GIY-YIG nuclease family protein [Alphaproteobacteria bacterium]